MRNLLAAAVVLGLLAGCSSDQDPSDSQTTAAADTARRAGTPLPFVARSMTTSFASLPDRGELLAYQQGQVKHSGAFTAYPVALSETHALNAIRTGEMVVKAPDGELIRLQYERFVEHPDGNWSWIGRDADGADAVLTFGEKAVFGTIPQGSGDSLRLTMSAGRSWLVSTNHAELPGPPRSDRPDHLVPPKLAAGSSSDAGVGTASMRAESATAAAASSVIDVLIGYTNGLASQLGSDSAAVTRANNLITITNQAYSNSGVNMRVRLVGAMKVNYPDNTDNGDALELLTGYRAGEDGGPIDVDPAFDALRDKRDELGADLVSLVRAFRTPDNNGCGIAWLIGGGQTGIVEADEPFGYSVVSDGVDLDEGDGHDYFCREETLAHEMGHNMGQAHNEEDSDGTGVHVYSYGYREAASDGFYTVMAYPAADSDQFAIRYFANPSIKVDGRPTGVANQSDNVRSMNITMPIIATFRDTVVPLSGTRHNDVDADSKSDLLFHNATINKFSYRIMDGTTTAGSALIGPVGPGYTVAATGDFNGDGKGDVIWTSARRDIYMWLGNGSKFTSSRVGAYPAGWTIAGAGDVNGDGKSDLLFHNAIINKFSYRIMNGTATVGTALIGPVGPGYTVAATGDFNGDGKADVIWTSSNHDIYMWLGNGTGFTSTRVGTYQTGWTIVGAGDVNGDGKSDLLFHNAVINKFSYRIMNGTATVDDAVIGPVGPGYTVAATGDFNGDSKADVIWTSANHDIYMWLGNGTDFTSTRVGTYPSGWKLIK